MSLLVRDGVSTEQLSSRDGRRQRARSKIEERSSMFGATWELAVLQAVLCAAQQPRVARAHAFASSRPLQNAARGHRAGRERGQRAVAVTARRWTCRAAQLHCALEVWMDGGTQNEGLE